MKSTYNAISTLLVKYPVYKQYDEKIGDYVYYLLSVEGVHSDKLINKDEAEIYDNFYIVMCKLIQKYGDYFV